MSTIPMIAAPQLYRPAKPWRNASYLRFVRKHPCAACARRFGIEAAHTGPHGVSTKASDDTSIPLCGGCHRELHRIGQVRFEARYGIGFERIIAELRQEFR